MSSAFFAMSSGKAVEPLSGSGRLISGEYDNSTKPCAVQAILESLMSQDMSDGTHRHTFQRLNIQHSTFHHQPKAGGPPLSREGNVLHASVNQILHSYLLQEEDIWYPGPY